MVSLVLQNSRKPPSSSYTFSIVLSPSSSVASMNTKSEMGALDEKRVDDGSPYADPEGHDTMATGHNVLHRDLQGRHMQMIAM